jgi:uncharacterized glyoxalase superfamily protein PhnB
MRIPPANLLRQGRAENFVFHARVEDLDAWWRHMYSLDPAATYGVQAARAPRLEPWGLRVAYVFDPSGTLWQFAANPAEPASALLEDHGRSTVCPLPDRTVG